jgi:hypothetical protein
MAALLRIIARHRVLAFMVIGLGAGFLTAAIRPIADWIHSIEPTDQRAFARSPRFAYEIFSIKFNGIDWPSGAAD